ncbi:polysaccharide pyruvyl transferase family protein [Colwellia sp. UCD-KL20]|uniref:polysaccharide pyruvyl transferase family protein n=1 Tax=Colwellia sp. UCD-KL20 TaxID=1917165 RepID=UPI0009708AC1|nr:polysaccharide pyruvyl transferase family protein [Colwellia sp. UCD-KL20]
MKKIVLYGAFDRYNYGDNIMPILFEMFIEKYAKHIFNDFVFEYAAISDSDLERYCCKPTKNINSFLHTMPADSALVVIGGEVLCTQNQTLYLHTQSSLSYNFVLKVFKKLLPVLFKRYAEMFYSAGWEYPFIPPKTCFSESIRIIYNTVGGDVKNLSESQLADVKQRFNDAAYFSVRDKRTFEEVSPLYSDTQLAPDSAYIMSDLLEPDLLRSKVSEEFLLTLPDQYYVFQAAPSKIGCSAQKLIKLISALATQNNKKIVLLPIGYASGHDDYDLLKKIHKALPVQTVLLYDLTIWEIMYTIQNGNMFFGTSLHGAITAMAYNIPHFGINPKVTKLDAYIQEWSVAPFNKCYEVEKLVSLPSLVNEKSMIEFQAKSKNSVEQVKQNFHRIIYAISTR